MRGNHANSGKTPLPAPSRPGWSGAVVRGVGSAPLMWMWATLGTGRQNWRSAWLTPAENRGSNLWVALRPPASVDS